MSAGDDFRKRLEARLWDDLERAVANPVQPRRSFRPLRSVECGAIGWTVTRGWRAYEVGFAQTAVYCPDCQAAEFEDE